jgi:AbrB family looped-hinge helix DNA binding protein
VNNRIATEFRKITNTNKSTFPSCVRVGFLSLRGTSRVTETGTITIPRELREHFKIEKGDIIGFYLDDQDRLFIKKS